MARYQVRSLVPGDFAELMELEQLVFGDEGEPVLGPYYVRLCCEMFADTCFVARCDGRIVGYLLSFVRERQAYCTTLAIHPDFQGTRVLLRLLQAFVGSILDRVDGCWFTVKPDNTEARSLHAMLGAVEIGKRIDFYGPGDQRIVSRIDRSAVRSLATRYARLRLIRNDRTATGEPERPAIRFALAAGETP
ncbi:MAG: GNAT family N-acetyltransferase [Deltaproteobacteria bacterium]|nr:GNAT family N-acetyltransferase [Deltaproteobacteria bacterium]